MRKLLISAFGLLLANFALAQISASAAPESTMPEPAPPVPGAHSIDLDAAVPLSKWLDELTFRPDANGVATVEKQLAKAANVSPAIKAQAEGFRKQAFAAMTTGRQGKSLDLLYQAISLLRGDDPAAKNFAWSLRLDLATPVADKGDPLFASLRGQWAAIPSSPELMLKFRVVMDMPNGAQIADLGTHRLYSSDFVAAPQNAVLSIGGIAPGHYRLEVQVEADGKLLTLLASPLDIAENVHVGAADMKRRLAKIEGHEAAKSIIRYPFSLYRAVNARQREVTHYDYQAGIAHSMELLNQLEAGKDPVMHATGDQRRAHEFAGEIIPYRLYVPKSWNGKAALPMVVFLHGAGGDENNGMDRGDGILPKLAEEKGFIALSPLGYRVESPYGAVLPREGGDFGRIADPEPLRVANSEAEVLAVTERVAKEYGVDRKRIYLMGNSMGGMGTWSMAAKHPEIWAAASPAAGGVNSVNFPYTNLKSMPIMAVAGEFDPARPDVLSAVAAAKAAGVKSLFKFVPSGTHSSGVEIAMPDIITFFLRQRRK